jgi:DNA-binding beta-propeller fold protein YncE
MKNKLFLLIMLLTLTSSYNLFSQNNNYHYKIANKFPLEGDDFWDCITMDDENGRLFVSHGTKVQVIDASTGTLLGTIEDTKGVHDIALAREFGEGYTSNGRDTSVTIFRLTTLEKMGVIKLINGLNPDVIIFDPVSENMFTFNGGTSNTSVINVRKSGFVVSFPLDGKPEFAATNGSGKIFVNIEDKSTLDVIDTKNLTIEHNWSLAPGEEPSGLAIDKDNNRLFSVCRNKLMIILDADDGRIITTLPIGERVDGVAYDEGLKRVYSSNGDGTLTVVQEENAESFNVLENFPTQRGARTIAVSQKTHHIYLPTAEFEPAPEPTPENPHPRPKLKPGSFVVLDIAPLE